MIGAAGDDAYYVDNVGDVVTELVNGGLDFVLSSIDYTLALGGNVEGLTLTGNAISAIGNELDNQITGNDQDNIIDGGAGNDLLYGGNGTLNTSDGSDILIG